MREPMRRVSFKNMPKNFPKITEKVIITKREGNIFSVWLGRKYLEQYTDRERICLLRNDLTHYSIRKATDVVGVKDFLIPFDDKSWSTSVIGLNKLVIQLYSKGLRGFLIPITLGYTVGGTNDDLKGIINCLTDIKTKYKDIHLFYWIDAALSGLVLPFIQKDFRPFNFPEIHTFIVDFHKFAGVPYPAGLILYRRSLRKLIEKDIPYIIQKDNTLLGSRSGIAAISIWTLINSYAFKGFKKEAEICIQRKNIFLDKLKRDYPDIKIRTNRYSVAACLIIKKSLPLDLRQKFGMKSIKKSFLNNIFPI
jgi:histidine decarboxylase